MGNTRFLGAMSCFFGASVIAGGVPDFGKSESLLPAQLNLGATYSYMVITCTLLLAAISEQSKKLSRNKKSAWQVLTNALQYTRVLCFAMLD